MSEVELLPCPFCGGEAECYTVQTIQLETGFVVKCKNLDCVMCFGGTLRQTPKEAIKAWNTRKPMEQIVERLEDLQQPCYECRESCNEKCVIERAIEIVKAVGSYK